MSIFFFFFSFKPRGDWHEKWFLGGISGLLFFLSFFLWSWSWFPSQIARVNLKLSRRSRGRRVGRGGRDANPAVSGHGLFFLAEWQREVDVESNILLDPPRGS